MEPLLEPMEEPMTFRKYDPADDDADHREATDAFGLHTPSARRGAAKTQGEVPTRGSSRRAPYHESTDRSTQPSSSSRGTLYVVAKANETAMAYVARTVRLKPGQIILAHHDEYSEACYDRDLYNQWVEVSPEGRTK